MTAYEGHGILGFEHSREILSNKTRVPKNINKTWATKEVKKRTSSVTNMTHRIKKSRIVGASVFSIQGL